MTISGFLPQRWRPSREIARHAEAIASVLHTAPLAPGAGGPAIISLLGAADVLPFLVAVKSLRLQLGRGSIVIIDDGTLTGEDRAILAHHCGDPAIRPHQAVARGAFPAGGAWALLLTVLDRRAGQYWLVLDPHTVTLGAVPEIEAAIAANRSVSLVAEDAPPQAALAALCEANRWRYRPGCAGLAGFAAGGTRRALAAAFLAACAESDPPKVADPGDALGLLLANEAQPVLLAPERYCTYRAEPWADGAAAVHFPPAQRYQGDGYAAAGRAAIAELDG